MQGVVTTNDLWHHDTGTTETISYPCKTGFRRVSIVVTTLECPHPQNGIRSTHQRCIPSSTDLPVGGESGAVIAPLLHHYCNIIAT